MLVPSVRRNSADDGEKFRDTSIKKVSHTIGWRNTYIMVDTLAIMKRIIRSNHTK